MLKSPMTISELALRVLQHPRGGVSALLDLVDRNETEWLELKAASYPQDGTFTKGDNEDDYRWDVAKAAIALANSVGGVVLLGMNDAGEPVGLEASDPTRKRERKGADAFRREVILSQVLFPKEGWRTGRRGRFRVLQGPLLERLINLQEVRCGDHFVLAIVVDPVPRGFGQITVEQTVKGAATQLVYARRRGSVGDTVELHTDDPAVHQTHGGRHERSEQEARLAWDRFLALEQVGRSVLEIAPDVRRYLGRIARQFAPLVESFTPLVAIERGLSVARSEVVQRDSTPGFDEDWRTLSGGPGVSSDCRPVERLPAGPAPRVGLVADLFAEQPRAVLTGEPGSGKTTCFARLAALAAEQWHPGKDWPLIASLAEYSQDGLPGLLHRRCSIEWHDLLPQVAEGRVVLYLDALNECPDSLYESCRSEIAGLLREYPGARIYLSARSSTAMEEFELPTFELRPMERSQQVEFMGALLGDPERATALLDDIHQQPGGDAIASSPVLLRIVAEVARESEVIPSGRAALYRRFLETWYARETRKAGLSGDRLPWTLGQTIDALSVLAFGLRCKGRVTCRLQHALDLVSPILGEDAASFLDRVSQGLILSGDRSAGTLGFWHETVQEYLCAEYLATRHMDLDSTSLGSGSETRVGTWAMPVAFALELITEPSDALLLAAWQAEPLIVSVASRSERSLAGLHFEGDAWTRGVLRALRGEDASAEVRAITLAARLPPKYPISPYLVSTLRSASFWYASRAHGDGLVRLERLRKILCGGRFPWIELLPAAVDGNPAWADSLGPAQRAVVGTSSAVTLPEVLATATVSEWCALRRRDRISQETFLSSWEHLIGEPSVEQLDLDLLDILRTESKSLRGMLSSYRGNLRRIAQEPVLSLRLLSVLVRDGVINARDVRRQPGRLESVLDRMSMMNAIRLAKSQVVMRSDLDSDHLARLLYSSSVKEVSEAVNVGLLLQEDLPKHFDEMIVRPAARDNSFVRERSGRESFRVADLSVKEERARIDGRLKSSRWRVSVTSLRVDGGFGFARHPSFDSDIFFWISTVCGTTDPPAIGQELDVRIAARFNRKNERWGFAVDSGRAVDVRGSI
jgi:hypothetical protein